jgi:hypothetical protein
MWRVAGSVDALRFILICSNRIGVELGLPCNGNNRLRVSHNGVLRIKIEPKGQEVTLRWKEQRNYMLHKICADLGYYATLSGIHVPTFWDNLSVPSSRARSS